MTREELIAEWERRRADAVRHVSTAPVAKVYEVVLDDLRSLDGEESTPRFLRTAEAAELLAVSPKTVLRRLGEDRFPGAIKTSGATGCWLIPAQAVYAIMGRRVARKGPKMLEE